MVGIGIKTINKLRIDICLWIGNRNHFGFVYSAITQRRPTICLSRFQHLVGFRNMNEAAGMDAKKSQTEAKCKFVSNEEIARGKWLSLNKLTYIDPTGKERVWEAVYRTTKQDSSADAAVIIPVLRRTLKFDCLILVKQYRPPIKGYTLEFPAGLIDKGEDVAGCALRELKEETGYEGIVKHTSPATTLDAGMGNATVCFVTVEIDGDEPVNHHPKVKPDEGEFIQVISIPQDDFLTRLNEYAQQGVAVDARVYSYAIALEQSKNPRKMIP